MTTLTEILMEVLCEEVMPDGRTRLAHIVDFMRTKAEAGDEGCERMLPKFEGYLTTQAARAGNVTTGL